jgi:Fe-S-cluster containining protein
LDPEFDKAFPFSATPEGHCEMLGDNNECLVYDTRPDVCRIDVMQTKYDIPEQEYFKLTAMVCNKLQENLRLDESLRVIIDEGRQDAMPELQ